MAHLWKVTVNRMCGFEHWFVATDSADRDEARRLIEPKLAQTDEIDHVAAEDNPVHVSELDDFEDRD